MGGKVKFGSIPDFLAFLRTRERAVEEARVKGMEAAGALFERTAKDMIGEEIEQWPDLAEATVEEKQRLGYSGRISPTDPLYRTGELRTSIGHAIDGNRVVLGSDDPIAEFHEFGTSRMPPRPFIGATVFREAHEAADLIANHELGAAVGLSGTLKPVQRRDGEPG